MNGPLDAAVLADRCRAPRFRRLICLEECDSTNLEALRRLAREGRGADGTVIFAEYQSAGRGRLGRSWHSPRGASLMLSAVVCEGADPAARLVLAAGLAVCTAVHERYAVDARIRWPNDVYVRGRKLAGILVETTPLADGSRAAVLGIGLNCLQHPGHFPPDVRDRATSLDQESREPVDRSTVAAALLESLDRWLSTDPPGGDEAIIEAWGSFSDDLGRRIELHAAGEDYAGTVVAIDPQAGLLVQLDGGGRALFDPAVTTRLA